MLFRFLMLIAALFGPAPAFAQIDRIYFNGNIITQDESRPRAQAMLIAGGRILAAGDEPEIRRMTAQGAHAVDLRGHTVIPGLIDSHIHAIRAGLTYASEVSWIDIPDLALGLRQISQAARADKEAWIVVAGGWNIQQFSSPRRPELADIEQAAPGRAVYIQLAYNAALISQEGLRRLAIDRDEHLPAGAQLERNKQGEPTGWIIGNAPAIIALFDILPKQTLAGNIEGTRLFSNS